MQVRVDLVVEIESILLDLAEKIAWKYVIPPGLENRPCRAAAAIKAEDGLGKAVELIYAIFIKQNNCYGSCTTPGVVSSPVFDEQ